MRQAARSESAFERNYRKAYVKLLTAATNAPRAVDEYFFGTADDRDEDTAELQAYFYGFIIFSIALTVFMHVVIK